VTATDALRRIPELISSSLVSRARPGEADAGPVVARTRYHLRSSAGFAGAIRILGEASEGAVEAPSE
jgi:hypothetical protein